MGYTVPWKPSLIMLRACMVPIFMKLFPAPTVAMDFGFIK